MKRIPSLLLFFLFACSTFMAFSQTDKPLEVLIITAHPDDETACAATVYKITHELKGHVDIAIITNGEGGFKYSTLAEDFYHLELTDEKTGRENLPRIRKLEMQNAGSILGLRSYSFLEQKDEKYTIDEKEPLNSWDVDGVKRKLNKILTKNQYDYVFCLLPVPETHGHHKAATMIALEVVNDLPKESRPIVLGMADSGKNDSVKLDFDQYKKYKLTAINKNAPLFTLDRTTKFGFKNALDYRIIVNWEIAEHKSQGTTQMDFNMKDYENFWYFAMNDPKGIEKTKQLFEDLKKTPYPVKTY